MDSGPVPARLLIPPAIGPTVKRPALVDRVVRGSTAPVTMIIAPAGWGKTTVAAQVAAKVMATGRAVTWLTVDEQHDLHTLLTDLVVGLRIAHPMLDLDLKDLEAPPLARDLPAVFDKIAAALDALVDDLLLVLDDVHLLADPAVLGTLAKLVRRRPAHLRVIMTGRTQPRLPLNLWRMNGLLDDVGRDDLAANADQARALLTGLGLRLPSTDVDRLVALTEGWIGGIRLAARSLLTASDKEGALDRLIRSRGLRGGLADYLIEQVVDDLPPATRTFLREISVVNPIPVDLAERLTGRSDARLLLRELSASIGFICVADAAERKYRMHQSLVAALHYQLDGESPDRRRALHREAASWFAEQDRPLPAAHQAILGQDWTAAGSVLMAGLPRLSLNGAIPQIRRLVGDIPRSIVLDDPVLAVIELGSRAWLGEYDDLQRLESAVEAKIGDLARTRPALADWSRFVLIMAQAGFARVSGRYQDAFDMVGNDRATRLTGSDGSADGARWRVLAQSNLGTAGLWSGHPAVARRSLSAAARSVDRLGFSLPALNSMSLLSWMEVSDGRLTAAAGRARQTIDAADRRGWNTVYQSAPAYLTLAVVALERADLDSADAELDRAREANDGWHELAITLLIECLGARVQTARGRPDEALARLAQLGSDPVTRPSTRVLQGLLTMAETEARWAAGHLECAVDGLSGLADVDPGLLALARARRAIAAEQPRLALELLAEPAGQMPLGRRRGTRIRHQLWSARACQLTGLYGRAVAGVRHALDIAGADGYRLPFLELGGHARPLLDLTRSDHSAGRRALLADLTALVEGAIEPRSANTDVGLTARERELLAFLPTRLTNDEIADQLGISVNTIKSHARTLYRKLDVPNRREAVRRAELNGLI